MVEFTGVIARGDIDFNGNMCTPKALKQLTRQLKDKPIGFEFNPHIPPVYGKIRNAIFANGEVIVKADIEKPSHEVRMFIVPSFIVNKSHKDGNINVLDDIELMEVCLTSQPSDRYLTPIDWRSRTL